MYRLHWPVTKMYSSLIIAFFTWTCLILHYSSRCNFLVTLHTIVVETCACQANCIKDLWGSVLIWLQFCKAFSRLKQHSVYCISCPRKTQFNTFFTNLKIADNTGTGTPGHLQWDLLSRENLLLTYLPYRKIHCYSVYFTIPIRYCKREHGTDFWMILWEQKNNENWHVSELFAGVVTAIWGKQ
jgi:hypothetical protein